VTALGELLPAPPALLRSYTAERATSSTRCDWRLETQELKAQMKELVEAVKAAPRGPVVKEGYIANTYHEGPIPQDYFLDQVRDHAKRDLGWRAR
jgi:hypothetical protein